MPKAPAQMAQRPRSERPEGEALRLVPKPPALETEAFTLESLFRTHSAYVAAIAIRLLGRDDDVDDVVQDVFLSAWKGVANLRDPGALKGWLATVTVRIARRKLKMRRVKMFLRLDDDPEYANIAATDASPEQKALLSKVYAILDTLPVDQRLAWTLRYVEREQLDDVARLCDCSLATAKRKITAAQQAISAVTSDAGISVGASHD
ncbi:MAG: RNA polymerase sigma factor [Polyangiales bacterium]